MSSQKDDSGATFGPGENEQVQQTFPGATWGGAENEQVQQPVPTSIPQTTDDQGDVDTSPVTTIQTSGNQDVADTTLASTTQISDNQGVANPPLPSTPQASGNQGVANIPLSSPPMGPNQQQNISTFKQRFVTFVEKYNFVLVPLVFAILIFFFTILFAIRNHVFLPPLALAMLLLALGVMQGTLLYYIDKSKNQVSKEMYWHLTVIIGFALFLVVGTLAIFGFGASIFFLILLLLGGVFVAPRAIHQVPEGSIDFMTLFSKHVRTLPPGPHVLWPLEKSVRLSTKEKNWEDPSLKVQITRDKNGEEYDFHLRAKLKYQLDPNPDKAQKAKLKVENWDKSVQEEFVTILKNVFREVTPEEVYSWLQGAQAQPAGATSTTGSTQGRTLEEITNTIKDLVQQEVDDWGVKVHKVDIQDLTPIHILTPRADPLRRPVAGQQTGTGSAGAQHTSSTTNLPVDQQPTIQFQPYPTPEYPAHSESEIELLKDSYEAVRLGRVTDPDTIRTLAKHFEEHLYDPNLDFFPLRAAEILYSRARYFEELKNAKRRTTGTVPVPGGNADDVDKDEKSPKTYIFY
jgi:regulator of protease activity HflC (stomatin/prohibitin superfamily)